MPGMIYKCIAGARSFPGRIHCQVTRHHDRLPREPDEHRLQGLLRPRRHLHDRQERKHRVSMIPGQCRSRGSRRSPGRSFHPNFHPVSTSRNQFIHLPCNAHPGDEHLPFISPGISFVITIPSNSTGFPPGHVCPVGHLLDRAVSPGRVASHFASPPSQLIQPNSPFHY